MWYDNWNNFSSFHGNWYLSAKTGLMYNMIPGVTPLIYFNCEDEFMSLGCELYKKYLRNSGRWLNLRNTVKHTEDLKIYTFRLQSFFNSSFHYKFIFKLSFRMQWIQLYFFHPKLRAQGILEQKNLPTSSLLLSRLPLYGDQVTSNTDKFLRILSLHVAIDSSHMKIYSRYFNHFIIVDGITQPLDILYCQKTVLFTTQNTRNCYFSKSFLCWEKLW